jgi:uncharacterized protein (TIGR03437 family)
VFRWPVVRTQGLKALEKQHKAIQDKQEELQKELMDLHGPVVIGQDIPDSPTSEPASYVEGALPSFDGDVVRIRNLILFMSVRCVSVRITAFLCCCIAHSQSAFSGLSSNADGSVLGFSLATDVKSKENERWRMAGGIRTQWLSAPTRYIQWTEDGSRALTRQSTSRLVNRPGCSGGSGCLTSVITTILTVEQFDSASGENRILWQFETNASVDGWLNRDGNDIVWQRGSQTVLTDLRSWPPKDTILSDPSWPIIGRVSDGRLIVRSEDGRMHSLRTLDGTDSETFEIVFRPSGYIFTQKLSADGKRIVYQSGVPGTPDYSLRSQDIQTGEDIELHAGLDGSAFEISYDGRVVLLLEGKESYGKRVYVSGLVAGVRQVLTDEPVESCTISANARYAFCVSKTGKILRVSLADDDMVDELVVRTPRINRVYDTPVAGSQVLVYGTGLADSRVDVPVGESWLDTLGGIQITSNSVTLPLGMVSPTLIRAQIPFQVTGRLENLTVTSDSPFQQDLGIETGLTAYPNLVDIGFLAETPSPYVPFSLAAVFNDDSPRRLIGIEPHRIGPITPNQRIHILATGLGPVVPAVGNGVPAPEEPVGIRDPIACWMEESKEDMPVEFAGLEPGMVGIYRITVRLPARLEPLMRCGRDPSRISGMFLILN